MAESFHDFVAGYVSGVAGIVVGSPLDVLKVRLQTATTVGPAPGIYGQLQDMVKAEGLGAWFKGIASPIVGLAGLNSVLFVSYGATLRVLERFRAEDPTQNPTALAPLSHVYAAGFAAGTACFIVSCPTELVKCRAQVITGQRGIEAPGKSPAGKLPNSWNIAGAIIRGSGLQGLYRGGVVTAIRDAPGYGVYFWVYEVLKRKLEASSGDATGWNAVKLILAGGFAGTCSWVSIYPLDVIKSRIQTSGQIGALACAKLMYQKEGLASFTKGLWPTVVRAFPVNAVTFLTYEAVMGWLVQTENDVSEDLPTQGSQLLKSIIS
ncbi:mitochondrial carrier [Basidiobolus meristosporus CBS 931.73]|uniref:Mitochondrial carrier n=1 Tax=Basidiobolus meristosporus CBS 931.73 TaxID=1314790 RepID=A0A1Y1YP83_9FUNG|nr:mitochondrial carrier [Basidiobolus meristosporus CBS 931.73]|eukprot:ORX99643.1 mitochondrial carrier [Basidiobolus meristosporus CBS 931.73]